MVDDRFLIALLFRLVHDFGDVGSSLVNGADSSGGWGLEMEMNLSLEVCSGIWLLCRGEVCMGLHISENRFLYFLFGLFSLSLWGTESRPKCASEALAVRLA